jgi:hypothetical protein
MSKKLELNTHMLTVTNTCTALFLSPPGDIGIKMNESSGGGEFK